MKRIKMEKKYFKYYEVFRAISRNSKFIGVLSSKIYIDKSEEILDYKKYKREAKKLLDEKIKKYCRKHKTKAYGDYIYTTGMEIM